MCFRLCFFCLYQLAGQWLNVGGGLVFSLLILTNIPSLSVTISRTHLLHFPTAGNGRVIFSCTNSLCGIPTANNRTEHLASRIKCRVFPHFSPSNGAVTFAKRCSNGARICAVPIANKRPLHIACATAGDQSSLNSHVKPGGVIVA